MSDNENTNGGPPLSVFYFDEKDIPRSSPSSTPPEYVEGNGTHHVEFSTAEYSTQSGAASSFTRKLGSWTDPLTPPKTRTKCVKYASWPGGKTCIGWKTQTKWMKTEATLIVQLKSPKQIKQQIEECMKTAAIGAAIAGIITGGSAAAVALEKLFFACLTAKLGDEIVSVRIHVRGRWSSWR